MKTIHTLVIAFIFLTFSTAYGFDYNRYKQGDLDSLIQLPKAEEGVRIVGPQKLRFQVVLSEYGQSCNAGFLKTAMIMAGAPKEVVEQMQISKCITVKTVKGATVSLFIQDKVAGFLPREIKLGERIEIFCDFLYLGKTGPGILVNEFQKIK